MLTVEEVNRNQYNKDMEQHDCGYWSVCDDHACGCAISDNVDGFDNEVYQKWKLDLHKQAEELYSDDDYYSDAYYEDEDNEHSDYCYIVGDVNYCCGNCDNCEHYED